MGKRQRRHLFGGAYAALLFAAFAGQALALEVAIIGDKSRDPGFQQLVREFGGTVTHSAGISRAQSSDGKITFTLAHSGGDPVAVANQLLSADVALMVVDSTMGPLPITRELVLVSRQADVPLLAVYFSRTRQLRASDPKDAAELLELESLEMQELYSIYKMGGKTTAILFDSDVSDLFKSRYSDGGSALRRFLAEGKPERRQLPRLQPAKEFAAEFYLLSDPETHGQRKAVSIANGSHLDVWLAGELRPAIIKTAGSFQPGDNGAFSLQLASSAPATDALRFLLLKAGVVVGLGVVTKVVH